MTKRAILFLTAITLIFLLTYAKADFTIEKKAVNDVVAIELTIPAKFDITINNNGPDGTFEFVTLLDAKILPKEGIFIPEKQSSIVPVTFLPNYRVKYNYNYEYFVRDNLDNSVQDFLYIKIRPLSEILSIEIPAQITRNDTSFKVKIINKENINLGDVKVSIDSKPIASSTTVAIPPNSEATANIPLANTNIKITEAGDYNFNVTLFLNNEYNYTVERSANIKEFSEILTDTKIKRSIFGYTKYISTVNNGNLKQVVTIEYKYAHFLEKIFTQFDVMPTEETSNKAIWQKQLSPGETFVIKSDTNYTVLIIIIILIVAAVIAYILFRRRKVLVSKKAIRVKTKGGEFAVKIILLIKNISNHEVGSLTLIDRLPLTTSLYEKFGSVKPDETEKHRLLWKFPSLLPGEEIVTSYIIYSKINMMGTIEMPKATLQFTDEKNRRKTVDSNKILVRAE